MDHKDKVLHFISRFKSGDKENRVEYVFTNGCCFWFAYILQSRFASDGAVIMYDDIMNHFGTEISGRIYDITGDVTEQYSWIPWNNIQDELHRSRIIRDCVLF